VCSLHGVLGLVFLFLFISLSLFFAGAGYFRLFLVASGCFWLLLVASGSEVGWFSFNCLYFSVLYLFLLVRWRKLLIECFVAYIGFVLVQNYGIIFLLFLFCWIVDFCWILE
jgi:hypothetical protein